MARGCSRQCYKMSGRSSKLMLATMILVTMTMMKEAGTLPRIEDAGNVKEKVRASRSYDSAEEHRGWWGEVGLAWRLLSEAKRKAGSRTLKSTAVAEWERWNSKCGNAGAAAATPLPREPFASDAGPHARTTRIVFWRTGGHSTCLWTCRRRWHSEGADGREGKRCQKKKGRHRVEDTEENRIWKSMGLQEECSWKEVVEKGCGALVAKGERGLLGRWVLWEADPEERLICRGVEPWQAQGKGAEHIRASRMEWIGQGRMREATGGRKTGGWSSIEVKARGTRGVARGGDQQKWQNLKWCPPRERRQRQDHRYGRRHKSQRRELRLGLPCPPLAPSAIVQGRPGGKVGGPGK